ncbi:MAG: GDSL-type esterase/lipase family protein [Sphaerochaeta sp.]|nr:GDSL-type esterase/lipase family protein [Sphaerochaeta sp.]
MDLLPYLHNTLSLGQDKDGYNHLNRFTESQRKSMGTHALYRAMSRTSSGCSLRFLTRGSSLSFRCKRFNHSLLRKDGDIEFDFPRLYGRKMEMRDYFDLVVDGVLVESFSLRTGEITAVWENAKKDLVEVELFFPLTHQVGIRDFSCNEPIKALGEPPSSLLVLGDSIVQGVGSPSPSVALTPRLAALSGLSVINQGLMGSLFNPDVAQDLLSEVHISKVIVGYGTNDWVLRPSLEELEEVVHELLTRLFGLYPATEILLLSPLWRSDWETQRAMGSFREMSEEIHKVSKGFPLVTFIDCLSCIDHTEEVFADGFLHPNEKGFSLYARSLEPYLM